MTVAVPSVCLTCQRCLAALGYKRTCSILENVVSFRLYTGTPLRSSSDPQFGRRRSRSSDREEAKPRKRTSPRANWVRTTYAARAILENAPVSSIRAQNIRDLNKSDPQMWTTARLSMAFKLPVNVIVKTLYPSRHSSTPMSEQRDESVAVLRSAERGLDPSLLPATQVVKLGVQYGLGGKKLSEFVDKRMSLDWDIARANVDSFTRRAAELGLKGPEASAFVRERILELKSRGELRSQAPLRPFSEDADQFAHESTAEAESSSDFDAAVENRLASLKDNMQHRRRRKGVLPDITDPSATLKTEDHLRAATRREEREKAKSEKPSVYPSPSDMLWNMDSDGDQTT